MTTAHRPTKFTLTLEQQAQLQKQREQLAAETPQLQAKLERIQTGTVALRPASSSDSPQRATHHTTRRRGRCHDTATQRFSVGRSKAPVRRARPPHGRGRSIVGCYREEVACQHGSLSRDNDSPLKCYSEGTLSFGSLSVWIMKALLLDEPIPE